MSYEAVDDIAIVIARSTQLQDFDIYVATT